VTVLDHRVPPPVIALLCAALAWGLASLTPAFAFSHPVLIPIAALLVLAALALEVSGLLTFRKAKTTVNPLSPGKLTTIVRSGPYRFTRNPMYLGMALLLSAFCLAEPSRHPWSWLLKRVFAVDIMVCSRCGGALRLVKIATRPDEIARALGEQCLLCGFPAAEQTVTIHGQLALHFR